MPTYHEIMTMDLSKLTTAAEKWDEMATAFGKVETAYKNQVHGITMGPFWIGLSANTAFDRFDITLKQYQAAQKEAKAIASLLRDAHTQFVDLRSKVASARDAAVAAGMKVSEQGRASFDFSKVDADTAFSAHHDPDLRETENHWSQHIQDMVNAVADADTGVKVALEAVVADDPSDSVPNGFNGRAKGDIESYEADEAKDIATRLNNGKDVSPAEIKELQRALRDNAHDKAFSQTLLGGLGPDGTIKLANKINERTGEGSPADRAAFRAMRQDLGMTLDTATTVPGAVADLPPGSPAFKNWENSPDGQFYKQWMQDVKSAGTKNYGKNTNPLYGYQVLVSTMQNSDTTFDDQFLYELGDDMIAAEKKHEGIFEQWGAGHEGVESDALDGLLGVMSRDPDTATAFFDASGNGTGADHVTNDHLKYLLGDGDGSRHWPKNHVATPYSVMTMEHPTNRVGLGQALEAATTGHPPLGPGESGGPPGYHTPAQARVMQNMINILDDGAGGDEIPRNLQKNIGRALADYVVDNDGILGESAQYGNTMGKDGVLPRGDEASINVSKQSLMRVMRGASEDHETAALLYDAQRLYSLDQLGKTEGDWGNSGAHFGRVIGSMDAIGSDIILDARDHKRDVANDIAKYGYHATAAPVAGLPYVGDLADRLSDAAWYEWSKDAVADADEKGKKENSQSYGKGVQHTYDMIDAYAKEHGVDPSSTKPGDPSYERWQAMRREAEQSYKTSRKDDGDVFFGRD